jgi:hypothetical protein
MKWDLGIDNIAGDVLTPFVDDLRASGLDKEVTWRISRQIASRQKHLGIQDAPRKRRPPTEDRCIGGSNFLHRKWHDHTDCVARIWKKGKEQIRELTGLLESCPDADLDFKRLEQIRGFLCHLSMTLK